MSWFRNSSPLVIVPVLAVLVLTLGCGHHKKKYFDDDEDVQKKDTAPGAAAAAPSVEKTPLDSGKGVLKGRITFDGDTPAPVSIKEKMIDSKRDVDYCCSADTDDPTWIVNPNNKGVQNVVVWLKAPAGKFFNIADDLKKRSDTVLLDQPVCAFKPHVVVVYPTYFDAKTKQQTPTGQKFLVKNSAKINHNTNAGGNLLINPNKNLMLASEKEMDLSPKCNRKSGDVGGEDLMNIKCDIHPWMNAKAWVFDHPFAAVSKADGSFEIKGLPEGELTLCYWHESFGDKPKTEKITITGDTAKDLVVKK